MDNPAHEDISTELPPAAPATATTPESSPEETEDTILPADLATARITLRETAAAVESAFREVQRASMTLSQSLIQLNERFERIGREPGTGPAGATPSTESLPARSPLDPGHEAIVLSPPEPRTPLRGDTTSTTPSGQSTQQQNVPSAPAPLPPALPGRQVRGETQPSPLPPTSPTPRAAFQSSDARFSDLSRRIYGRMDRIAQEIRTIRTTTSDSPQTLTGARVAAREAQAQASGSTTDTGASGSAQPQSMRTPFTWNGGPRIPPPTEGILEARRRYLRQELDALSAFDMPLPTFAQPPLVQPSGGPPTPPIPPPSWLAAGQASANEELREILAQVERDDHQRLVQAGTQRMQYLRQLRDATYGLTVPGAPQPNPSTGIPMPPRTTLDGRNGPTDRRDQSYQWFDDLGQRFLYDPSRHGPTRVFDPIPPRSFVMLDSDGNEVPQPSWLGSRAMHQQRHGHPHPHGPVHVRGPVNLERVVILPQELRRESKEESVQGGSAVEVEKESSTFHVDPLPMPLDVMSGKPSDQPERIPDVVVPSHACIAGR